MGLTPPESSTAKKGEFQEFPKMLYHENLKDTCIVKDEKEQKVKFKEGFGEEAHPPEHLRPTLAGSRETVAQPSESDLLIYVQTYYKCGLPEARAYIAKEGREDVIKEMQEAGKH